MLSKKMKKNPLRGGREKRKLFKISKYIYYFCSLKNRFYGKISVDERG